MPSQLIDDVPANIRQACPNTSPTWLGNLVGWRTAFGIMSLLTLLLIAWMPAKVPDYPGQSGLKRLPLRQVFATPGVRPVLGVVMTWMLAHNILYTYVAPFVAPAGLGGKIDVVLLVFGVAALAGIWITGRVVDRHLRAAVLASLGAFALTALVLGLRADSAAVMYTCVGVWGLTFGGAATLLQTALADAAADGADVALSMNVVTWNSTIAGGRLLGGLLLGDLGVASFPVGRVDPGVGQYVDRTRGTRTWISTGTQGIEFRGRAALMPNLWHIQCAPPLGTKGGIRRWRLPHLVSPAIHNEVGWICRGQ